MKIRTAVVLALALAIALPMFAETKSPMKPGKWQISMQMEMPNMPMKIPPVTITNCVTQEQLDQDPQASIPKDKKSDCKVSDYKVDGSTVSWTVDCPKSNMKGSGEMTFEADGYTGALKMDMGEQQMTTKLTGKRLGDCEK